MGGEAVLPLHVLREVNAQGHHAELLTHGRCRGELEASEYARFDLHFLPDSLTEKTIWYASRPLPRPVPELGKVATGLATLNRLVPAARRLIRARGFDLVHQVTPVSPRQHSPLYGLGAPVVIGPLNGDIDFPPGFEAHTDGEARIARVARIASRRLNDAYPGKARAARVLVANQRTAGALPGQVDRQRIIELVENGVDLSRWTPPQATPPDRPTITFVGRLVRWKAVTLLLDVVSRLPGPLRLNIVGEGEARAELEAQAKILPGTHEVVFTGLVPTDRVREIVAGSTLLALPSLRECGGAVVLEAMACGRPAVATDWGGPADYIVDGVTGLLVRPTDEAGFVRGLSEAMQRLIDDPALADRMGAAGRKRIEQHFAWQAKGRRLVEIYEEALADTAPATGGA